MSPENIFRKIIEEKIDSLGYPVAWQNVEFDPPEELYLAVSYSFRKPNDNSVGSNCEIKNANVNIYVMEQINTGTGNALEVVYEIEQLFKRGTTNEESNVRLMILNSPHVAGSIPTTQRMVIPIIIPVTIFIY